MSGSLCKRKSDSPCKQGNTFIVAPQKMFISLSKQSLPKQAILKSVLCRFQGLSLGPSAFPLACSLFLYGGTAHLTKELSVTFERYYNFMVSDFSDHFDKNCLTLVFFAKIPILFSIYYSHSRIHFFPF